MPRLLLKFTHTLKAYLTLPNPVPLVLFAMPCASGPQLWKLLIVLLSPGK